MPNEEIKPVISTTKDTGETNQPKIAPGFSDKAAENKRIAEAKIASAEAEEAKAKKIAEENQRAKEAALKAEAEMRVLNAKAQAEKALKEAQASSRFSQLESEKSKRINSNKK